MAFKPLEHNKDYPNTGVLFLNSKKEGKAPDYKGIVFLAGEIVDYIIQRHEDGKDVVLDLSSWLKESKVGNQFHSITVAKPWVPKESAEEKAPWEK